MNQTITLADRDYWGGLVYGADVARYLEDRNQALARNQRGQERPPERASRPGRPRA